MNGFTKSDIVKLIQPLCEAFNVSAEMINYLEVTPKDVVIVTLDGNKLITIQERLLPDNFPYDDLTIAICCNCCDDIGQYNVCLDCLETIGE